MTSTVLFVCVHNAGRSQMAAALLERAAGDAIEVRSAGSLPASALHPVVVEAMREIGIDLAGRQPRALDVEEVETSDVVITMGCGDACPVFAGVRYLDWELDDPSGASLEEVRAIRDEIDRRVRELADELRT
jgi:arsenate reductase